MAAARVNSSVIREVRVQHLNGVSVAVTEHTRTGRRAVELRRTAANGRVALVAVFADELDAVLDAMADAGEELEAE